MDDRQRWSNHGPARGGNYGAHWQRSGRALRRSDSGIWQPVVHPHRRARHAPPATPEQKAKLQKLSPDVIKESDLAGEPITAKLTKAPGNDAPIGGLKVVAASGGFAARPSGTENIYKIYAESFKSEAHLAAILNEAQAMVNHALGSGAR